MLTNDEVKKYKARLATVIENEVVELVWRAVNNSCVEPF
jgi:hypothetical protein